MKTGQTHYRRENLFLNALMVLAIMGAISAGEKKQNKLTLKIKNKLYFLFFNKQRKKTLNKLYF